eukprot:SAG11_NODE_2055_length_3878_cov_1.734057_1_plen_151_part_00
MAHNSNNPSNCPIVKEGGTQLTQMTVLARGASYAQDQVLAGMYRSARMAPYLGPRYHSITLVRVYVRTWCPKLGELISWYAFKFRFLVRVKSHFFSKVTHSPGVEPTEQDASTPATPYHCPLFGGRGRSCQTLAPLVGCVGIWAQPRCAR